MFSAVKTQAVANNVQFFHLSKVFDFSKYFYHLLRNSFARKNSYSLNSTCLENRLVDLMDEFVLIPNTLYKELTASAGGTLDNQSLVEKSLSENRNLKKEILDNPKILEKSKLISALADSQHHSIPQQSPTPSSSSSETTAAASTAGIQQPAVNILGALALEGVKKQRSELILQKLLTNPRLGLSASHPNSILIDGIDSGVPVTDFLYKLQTRGTLTPVYQDIFSILELTNQHATVKQTPWVYIKR